MTTSKHYKDMSVKAYAKLINKSDKTVYKMIKDGFIAAYKEDGGYMIRVDNFMIKRCEDMNKKFTSMKEQMDLFSLRLESLENKALKVNKKIKKNPLKKCIKKSLIKSSKKRLLKPLKRNTNGKK